MVEPIRVDRLRATQFRNLSGVDFEPTAHFNIIHGFNGAGKSNLLEAIYYLCALKSFRGAHTDDLIHLGADEAGLNARFVGLEAPLQASVQLTRGRARRLALDGKRPRSIAVWHRAVQAVVFHPGDIELSRGGPALRRAFLDRILEQLDPAYSQALGDYQKALRSRNKLLKSERFDAASCRAYDEILATRGEVIGKAREALVPDLATLVVRAFTQVIGESLSLHLVYEPRVEPDANQLRERLREAMNKDRARGFTADGPHADELGIHLGAAAAKHHASQGQHRAIVLALKVAELDILTERRKRVPILLLDDVSSELDRERNRRFFQVLGGLGGQVFLTTTHPEFIVLDHDRADFKVVAGRITVS